MESKNLKRAIYYIAQAMVVLLVASVTLKLWEYDLRVPFNYSGDSVVILMYVKAIIQNGWTFVIPQLSAPYSMSAAAFPLATSIDWGVMKVISLFTSEPGTVLNVFWFLTLVFSAWGATLSMNLLGLNKWVSFATGVLFAFLPFALLRNVSHLNLVYYTVPFLSLLAIHIMIGNDSSLKNKLVIRRIGYVACFIQGFNYIYFSFFAVFLFCFAAAVSYSKTKSRKMVRVAMIAISIISMATLLNLSPSFISWYQHGKPPEMGYKHIAEAEIFGAKMRKMIAPHPDNPIYIFSKWGKRDFSANFPNENENVTVRLGLYASAGFLFLLLVSLSLIRVGSRLISSVAILSLFTLLMITVGGGGAIFNLLVVPDIRAYNRFSVFIAFFSMVGIGWWVTQKVLDAKGKLNARFLLVGIAGLITLSLYDQLLDAKGLLHTQKNDMRSANQERGFVRELERNYPEELNVFQLPVTGFPPLSVHERMFSYDHLKPYLWSTHLNWSWPSFSQAHRNWQDKVSVLEGHDLLRALVLSGFDLIWLDNYAYKDSGEFLKKQLLDAGASEVMLGGSERYTILDILAVKEQLLRRMGDDEFQTESDKLLAGFRY